MFIACSEEGRRIAQMRDTPRFLFTLTFKDKNCDFHCEI